MKCFNTTMNLFELSCFDGLQKTFVQNLNISHFMTDIIHIIPLLHGEYREKNPSRIKLNSLTT